jgi:hypothetical protein
MRSALVDKSHVAWCSFVKQLEDIAQMLPPACTECDAEAKRVSTIVVAQDVVFVTGWFGMLRCVDCTTTVIDATSCLSARSIRYQHKKNDDVSSSW